MGQLYLLLGSADVLGNPVGLVGNLRTGLTDFFMNPADALSEGDMIGVGMGLASGTASLLQNTTYGVTHSLAKMTATVSTGVAQLAGDDEYLKARKDAKIRRHQSGTDVGEDVVGGVGGMAQGLADGITGLVTQPMKGFRDGGITGGAMGFAKGVLGVVARQDALLQHRSALPSSCVPVRLRCDSAPSNTDKHVAP